jgi:hypothetical protein
MGTAFRVCAGRTSGHRSSPGRRPGLDDQGHGDSPPRPELRAARGPPRQGRVGSGTVNWVYTVLLIAVSAGTVGFGGWLLRRLFTTEPGTPDLPAEPTS